MFKHKSEIFRYFLVCFIVGVGVASFLNLSLFYLGLLALVGIGALLILFKKKDLFILIFGILFLSLGIWRYQISVLDETPKVISFYNGQSVKFLGEVILPPDIRPDYVKLVVQVKTLTSSSKNLEVSGSVLINTSLYPSYDYGDSLSISCQLKAPQRKDDFLYDRYLAKEGIYSICGNAKIIKLSSDNGNFLFADILKFRNRLEEIINSNLPEPQASLFAAIFLGLRRGIPQKLSDQFNITGTTHLIAISGLNITIIVMILLQVFLSLYIPRKKAFWFVTVILVLYIIIIGYPASAVRAAIMGWLAMLALAVGRLNQITNTLILAAGLMILLNPKVLRDDAGFQLSFCAILGLIYVSPIFEDKLKKLPSFLAIKESVQTTLAAQVSTLPLIIYNFGRLSLIGPVTNLLVLPVVPFLTVAGFVVLFLSLILPPVAPYLFFIIWLTLTYIIKVVEFLSLIPLAAISFS